ncbi:MAG: hypothetical protein RML36_03970 [Anaerolineae bacterium]|nr:hypothetical protein [Anaerolineae bacterium]MDW8098627.1 hypothetical protein [Anaerolineae bacterium]
MQWLISRYQPTGLFSLKHGDATSTGGKSLLVPTPFAIRTALLDVAIRVDGIAAGPRAFAHIKALRLAMRPPAYAAVTSTFVKILKPERDADVRGRKMQQTIAFREYVHLAGELALAFGGPTKTLTAVEPWLQQVNYFGKRGSFYQLLGPPESIYTETEALPTGFIELRGPDLMRGGTPSAFPLGILQRLDDWGEELTFTKVNIYARARDASIKLGRERVRMDVVFPYTLVISGRGFALYRRRDLSSTVLG